MSLYFKYGAMNSSKSANMLMTRHNYIEQDFSVLLLKPVIDTRGNKNIVSSRIGLSAPCVRISDTTDIATLVSDYDVIMVDECQFLTKEQVNLLYQLSFTKVILCYGLLTDFRRELFPGSKRLIELADSLQEIKSVCRCGKRAVANARFDKYGNICLSGDQIEIGSEEKYRALCKECYEKEKKMVITRSGCGNGLAEHEAI